MEATGLRILVVEDHPDVLTMVVMLLKTLGHEGIGVADVAAARRALETDHFDLLLTDYGLPDGTGLDVLALAREHGLARSVLVTAYGMPVVRRGQQEGFSVALLKPVDLETLEGGIEQGMNDQPPQVVGA